jgi:hypothetical protein
VDGEDAGARGGRDIGAADRRAGRDTVDHEALRNGRVEVLDINSQMPDPLTYLRDAGPQRQTAPLCVPSLTTLAAPRR